MEAHFLTKDIATILRHIRIESGTNIKTFSETCKKYMKAYQLVYKWSDKQLIQITPTQCEEAESITLSQLFGILWTLQNQITFEAAMKKLEDYIYYLNKQ